MHPPGGHVGIGVLVGTGGGFGAVGVLHLSGGQVVAVGRRGGRSVGVDVAVGSTHGLGVLVAVDVGQQEQGGTPATAVLTAASINAWISGETDVAVETTATGVTSTPPLRNHITPHPHMAIKMTATKTRMTTCLAVILITSSPGFSKILVLST